MRLCYTERKINVLLLKHHLRIIAGMHQLEKLHIIVPNFVNKVSRLSPLKKKKHFIASIEIVISICSVVTLNFVNDRITKRFRPQSGKVVVRFGGGSEFMSPFQETADQYEQEQLLKKQKLSVNTYHVPGVASLPPKQFKYKLKSDFGKF
jgi:hypothetical protein